MAKQKSLLLIFILFIKTLYAQYGGQTIFAFLDYPNSPRIAALGGMNVSIYDKDLSLAENNPALIDSSLNNYIYLNYSSFVAGIKTGYLSYAIDAKKFGTFATGIKYINYGTFTQADEQGNITGKFTANELALNIIWAISIDTQVVFGVNVKPIYSHLYKYISTGIAADLGLFYHSKDYLTGIGIVLKNIGTQIKTYVPQNKEQLPFDIALGFSQKLKHAPFRFSLTAHYLNKFNLLYQTYNRAKIWDYGENLLRHLIFGVEIIPSKFFYADIGFNYKRHQEMHIQGLLGSPGFNFGLGIKLYNISINYSFSKYYVAANMNNFSLTFNISQILTRKNK